MRAQLLESGAKARWAVLSHVPLLSVGRIRSAWHNQGIHPIWVMRLPSDEDRLVIITRVKGADGRIRACGAHQARSI